MSTWLKTSLFLSDIEKCIKEDLAETGARYLSVTAVYILAALYKKDEQRPSDLASTIGVPATSFTPVLDRLEAAGFIQRGINVSDRRSILISLTSEGKKLETIIRKAVSNAEVRYGGG